MPDRPDEAAADRWLRRQHRELVHDLSDLLDVEAGLHAITKTGKVLTDADVAALAAEAERGYRVTCACGARVDDEGVARGGDTRHQHTWTVG